MRYDRMFKNTYELSGNWPKEAHAPMHAASLDRLPIRPSDYIQIPAHFIARFFASTDFVLQSAPYGERNLYETMFAATV